MRDILKKQHAYFASEATRKPAFRREMLRRLLNAVQRFEPAIIEALHQDLRKSRFESLATEISGTLTEIRFACKHLRSWQRPRRVSINSVNFPARGHIYPEPYGSVLIFSAWNYPMLLMLTPLVSAIAAGNCAVLKPAEQAPATMQVMAELIADAFPPEYVTVIQGGTETARELTTLPFDYIFFTGSTKTAREVMRSAAANLTPVTLELGGKNPCIVADDANINLAAKRIVWGKFLNAGQTCVAPDYLLVHSSIKTQLLDAMQTHIQKFYGKNPQLSPDYPRIVNQRHFDRLAALLENTQAVCGGVSDREDLYIAPSIIDQPDLESPLMREEIFGPILPILTFETIEQVIEFVNTRPKPLALYCFCHNRNTRQQLLHRTSAGGVCINETVMHLTNPTMPFGGIGNSGMGAYHGKYGFDTFSHYKPAMTKSTLFDLPVRYPPYTSLKQRLLRWLT